MVGNWAINKMVGNWADCYYEMNATTDFIYLLVIAKTFYLDNNSFVNGSSLDLVNKNRQLLRFERALQCIYCSNKRLAAPEQRSRL